MAVNEERDVVLGALHKHFGRHRISFDRLHAHLVAAGMDGGRIDAILSDLHAGGYVGMLNAISFHEYWITPKARIYWKSMAGLRQSSKKKAPCQSV